MNRGDAQAVLREPEERTILISLQLGGGEGAPTLTQVGNDFHITQPGVHAGAQAKEAR